MVEGLRGQVITLACLRHQLPAHEGRGVDRLPQSMLDDLTETLVARTTDRVLTTSFTRLIGLLLREADHVSPKLAERLREPFRTLEITAARAPG